MSEQCAVSPRGKGWGAFVRRSLRALANAIDNAPDVIVLRVDVIVNDEP